MIKLLFLFLAINLLTLSIKSQSTDIDYEKFKLGDAKHLLTGIDISPDGSNIAVCGHKNYPLYIYNLSNREVVKEIEIGDWFFGGTAKYSTGGKYILVQQLLAVDWAWNKDKEVIYEILSTESGEKIKRFNGYHSMSFSPDEKHIVSLSGEEVAFWDLENLKKEKSFTVNLVSNGLAISPDGKYIAISHKPVKEELENIGRLANDKKAIKTALKYNQLISVFDANTFERLYTVNEMYGIIYRLEYSADGKYLFCLEIPHQKQQSAYSQQRQTHISTINSITGSPTRKSFMSNAPYEPDFKLSPDGSLFGLISRNKTFIEVQVFDFESRKMIGRFEQSYRLYEKNEGEHILTDSKAFFVFLPDNKSVLMTMGNRLVLWNLKLEE